MTTKLLAALAGAAVLVPAVAFAEVQVVDGEAGMIFPDVPSTLTREQVRQEMKAAARGEGGFVYVGGEAGWTYEGPGRIVFEDGRFAHAADCPALATLDAPRPTIDPATLPAFGA